MTMAEDFETSKKAYQFALSHFENLKNELADGYRGMGHRVNKQAAEIEDLQRNDQEREVMQETILKKTRSLIEDLSELRVIQDKITGEKHGALSVGDIDPYHYGTAAHFDREFGLSRLQGISDAFEVDGVSL